MWHAHHAVAETLHLELTNVASPFAFALLLANQLVTLLLQRSAIVSCLGSLRGLRWSRQRNERKRQYDRPRGSERIYFIAPYVNYA
jgi:hypothetical protein